MSSSHSMSEYVVVEEHSCVQYSIVGIMYIEGIFRLLSQLCLFMILTPFGSACSLEFPFINSRKYLNCSMKS